MLGSKLFDVSTPGGGGGGGGVGGGGGGGGGCLRRWSVVYLKKRNAKL